MARMIESLIDGMYESRDRPRVAYMLIHVNQTKKRVHIIDEYASLPLV